MTIKLSDLTKDINKIDHKDIISDWAWLIDELKQILMVTKFGDLFFTDTKNEVYWLDTGAGLSAKVGDSVDHFEEVLKDKEKFSEWFLTDLYLQLQEQGRFLQENEVYSFQTLPILGGEYSTGNLKPTDISVHFAINGQICKNLKHVPDGTKIELKVDEGKKPWWKFGKS
ncbi:T6SS immunity protein Tdi1 domain-containing protein [Pedobacter sp. ASV28]|uniref:T6SS immunity protein Tdi1 domain-containing protein n=1 Tax=Pedobacter sp. ASV28 TaxID=2795123 RepID=UPI0018EC2F66|nr:T6SS immunity protein Tdi1 domain-containing protein [Pedobacter sp. ASV28]